MTGNRPRTFNPVLAYQFQADGRIIPICRPERIPFLHRFTRTSAYGSTSGRNGVNPCGKTTWRRWRLASFSERFQASNTDATTADSVCMTIRCTFSKETSTPHSLHTNFEPVSSMISSRQPQHWGSRSQCGMRGSPGTP